jgi:hypothetical protein
MSRERCPTLTVMDGSKLVGFTHLPSPFDVIPQQIPKQIFRLAQVPSESTVIHRNKTGKIRKRALGKDSQDARGKQSIG